MVTGETVTQGDHVKVGSSQELEKKLPFILKRMDGWDYQVPMVVKLEPYQNPRSLSQNAMSHIWYKEIAKKNGKKKATRLITKNLPTFGNYGSKNDFWELLVIRLVTSKFLSK